MAEQKISTTLTLGYSNTDATRKFKIDDVARSDVDNITAKVNAINASLAGGSDGGLGDFFRANDYDDSDPSNIVGKFNRIVAAQTDIDEETVFNMNEE